MTKSQLRETIAEMETLCNQWINFRKYFNPENVTPAMESEFSKIKSDVMSRHRTLLSVLEFDIEVAQTMLECLNRVNSPRDGSLLSVTTRRSLEDEWNSAYLLMQETMGLLEYRLEEKSMMFSASSIFRRTSRKKNIEERSLPIAYRGRILKRRGFSPVFKLFFALIVLGVVIAVLWYFNILQGILSDTGLQ